MGRLGVRSFSATRVQRAFEGRTTALASGLALAVAATTVVVLAVSADGYRSHEARLNDGGVWVTSNTDGYFGRVNKPIGQMDGGLFAELGADLDVVQDGGTVLGLNRSAGSAGPHRPGDRAAPRGRRRRRRGQRRRGRARQHHRRHRPRRRIHLGDRVRPRARSGVRARPRPRVDPAPQGRWIGVDVGDQRQATWS